MNQHQGHGMDLDSPSQVLPQQPPSFDQPLEHSPHHNRPMQQPGWHNPFSLRPHHPANLSLPQMQEEDEFFNQAKTAGHHGHAHQR